MHDQIQPLARGGPPPLRGGSAGRVIAAGVTLACLYVAGSVVMTLVVALLLMFLCDPAVTWLRKHGVPRGIGAFLMVLVLLAAAYGLFYLFYAQAENLYNDLSAGKYSRKNPYAHDLVPAEDAADPEADTDGDRGTSASGQPAHRSVAGGRQEGRQA